MDTWFSEGSIGRSICALTGKNKYPPTTTKNVADSVLSARVRYMSIATKGQQISAIYANVFGTSSFQLLEGEQIYPSISIRLAAPDFALSAYMMPGK